MPSVLLRLHGAQSFCLKPTRTFKRQALRKKLFRFTARQLLKIFQRDIITYRVQQEELVGPKVFLLDEAKSTDSYTTQKEQEVARWVLTNNKRAGAGTDTLSDSCCTYLSVRTGKQVYGVVGIAALDKPLDSFETSILFSVLGEMRACP